MPYGEADTRAKLIDPALHACGWTEDLILRKVTAGGRNRRRAATAPSKGACRLAGQFARAGTESLENPQVFEMPDVFRAGDLPALKTLGEPADVLRDTKERLFAA